jgi:very-short-patch-repair endonuclease
MTTEWVEITRSLGTHHGVIDRAELDRLGVTKHQLGAWVAAGALERAAPRVWRLVGSADTWRQRLVIGTLSLGFPAGASHEAAAQLLGFERTPPDIVEFLVDDASRGARLAGTVHCSKLIRPYDFVTVDGIRCTSATRTIVDLANVQVHPDRLRAAIDSAIRLQLSSPSTIAKRVYDIRRRGRTGVRALDDQLVDSGGHTMLERHFLRLMREADLPRPATQVVFRDSRRTVARVDFLFRHWGIVVEVSGRLGHSSPTERARDAQRRNELQDLGLRVYEFTWEDITRRPWVVVDTMRALLTQDRSTQQLA